MRYEVIILTGPVDEDTFHRLLARVFKALSQFQNVAVRFRTYDPEENGAG